MATFLCLNFLSGDTLDVHPGMPHRLFEYTDDFNEHRSWTGDLFVIPCLFGDRDTDIAKLELSEDDRRKLLDEHETILVCYDGDTTNVLQSVEFVKSYPKEPWVETCEISLISEEEKDALIPAVEAWAKRAAERTERIVESAPTAEELAALMGDKSEYEMPVFGDWGTEPEASVG